MEAVDRDDLFRRVNEGILEERAGAFRRNLRKNIELIRRWGGLARVVPLLQDKTVIVAGAGPSLAGDTDILRRYQHRRELAVIAADMALAPLLKRGIRPRFVITCETTPAGFFNGLPTEGMHLLAFSCASNASLRAWKGDISFYNWMLRGDFYEGLWREAGEDLGYVATGGIVTTQAVSIALGCAIRALVLCGNDMAFRHSFYLPGTLRHRHYLLRENRFETPEGMEFRAMRGARDYEVRRGQEAYGTSGQFLSARMWLEDLFRRQKLPIFDSSVPGLPESVVRRATVREWSAFLGVRKGR